MDFELGYRFARLKGLKLIGKPAPYVIASLNSQGDTSFAGGGAQLEARQGTGLRASRRRPDRPRWPSLRVGPDGLRTDLGSRVLFEPEMALGLRLSPTVAVEASWVHISNARLFNHRQNPGIDMWGVRLAYALR